MDYIDRTIFDRISSRLSDNKAIVLKGARQVGKTTLLTKLFEDDSSVLYVNGDRAADRQRWASIDFTLLKELIEGYSYLVIDEAQRIENVGLTAKQIIDEKLGTKVVLTGSSSLNLASTLNEPLTGRKWTFELYPLSWSEIVSAYRLPDALDRLNELLVYGCYPEVVKAIEGKRDRLIEITDSYLYKDVLEYGNVRKPDLIVKLLSALAYQVGNEVSYLELGNLLDTDAKTIARYIKLLEDAYVLLRLPPLSTNPRKEISTSRKIYFLDNGIRNAVINDLDPWEERRDKGALWENFIVIELYKQYSNWNMLGRFHFWRSRQQSEVDLVIASGTKYRALKIKYNPKKARTSFPPSFIKRYQPKELEVVHRDNFHRILNTPR